MIVRLILSAFSALLLTACASGGGGVAPITAAAGGERYASQEPGVIENYKLGVGDKVRITIFNEPTLSGEFTVSAGGDLSVPLVGDIRALNKTPQEIAVDLQTKLGQGYLRDPKISAEVATYRPYFILGEVKAPGQYPYVNGLTILNAVATAEGYTPRAQKSTVFIREAGSSVERAYEVSPNLRVLPGDTVRIGERYF